VKLSFALILIVSVLLVGGASGANSKPPVSKNEESASDDKQHKANDSKANKSQRAEEESKAGIEHGPRAQGNKATNYPNGDADQFWVWPPTSGWAVVYITAVYAAVALGQLWFIRRQATIAKRAITHFERPWVRVDPKDPTLPNKELGFGTMIPWTATNVGKSPAFITRLFVDVKIFPTPTPPDQRPQYGDPPRIARFMLSPHGGQHSSEGRLSGIEPQPMSAGELRDMWRGQACLVFYGFIDYLDAVGTLHTTRFCSYWDHNFVFNPVGPDAWIEYT